MGESASGPSSALSSLSRARLDDLLEEVLQRVEEVLVAQDRLRGLLDAVVAIASDLSLDRVLQRIVDVASELVGARYAALGVLTTGPTGTASPAATQRRLREFITHGLTDEQRAAIGDLPRGHGILGLIIDQPEPLRLDSLGDHARSYGFPPHHPPMRTFLGVPVRIRDRLFGNLYLTEKEGGGSFTEEDEQIVVALAAAAGVVIENARLYEDSASRQRWLEAAAECTAALLGPGTRASALQLVVDRACQAGGADVGALLLHGDDGDMVLEAVSGREVAGVPRAMNVPSDSLAGRVLASGATELDAAPVQGHVLGPDAPWLLPDVDGPGPVVALPLRSPVAVDGVLVLGWLPGNDNVLRGGDLEVLGTFSERVALALQVARAEQDRALLAVFEDRDRIGRDLHDLVIQRLFAIGLALDNASRLAVRPEVQGRISSAVDDLDATIKDIRRTIFELSAPGRSSDLRHELRAVLDDIEPALGFPAGLTTEGPVEHGVPDAVRPHLLAVLREALSNAARHAAATRVDVGLTVGEDIVLTVTDDGRGLGKPTQRSGLANIAERANLLGGVAEASPGPGGGTRVTWSVPART
jgi:signal transduction histidine kinase